MRVIKKYPNRRLYDTAISSYVTLDDIRQLVLQGVDFEVQDVKSGQDLTRTVLLQIIAEHEQGNGQPMLSSKMLSQLIRFYGDQLQGYMGSYLERSLQGFLDQQEKFRAQLSQLIGATPLSMLGSLAQRNLDALGKVFGSLRADGESRAAPVVPEPQKPPEKAPPPPRREGGGALVRARRRRKSP